jgi:hypothetical protein
MNGASIIPEVNGFNPLDFQRVEPTANMLSYSFTFYPPNRYQSVFCGKAIRRLRFHFKPQRRRLLSRRIQPKRCWSASSA